MLCLTPALAPCSTQPDDNDGNAGRALPQPAARALPDLPPPLPDLPPPLPNLPAAPGPGRTFSLEQVLAWGGAAAAPDGADLGKREVRCVLCCPVQATGRRSRTSLLCAPLLPSTVRLTGLFERRCVRSCFWHATGAVHCTPEVEADHRKKGGWAVLRCGGADWARLYFRAQGQGTVEHKALSALRSQRSAPWLSVCLCVSVSVSVGSVSASPKLKIKNL